MSKRTLEFIFSVVDPFINTCWNYFAIDYCEDTEPYINFLDSIILKEIPFLVSPESLEDLDDTRFMQSKNLSYVNLMKTRIAVAKKGKQDDAS